MFFSIMGNIYHKREVRLCTPSNGRYKNVFHNIVIKGYDRGYKRLSYEVFLKKDNLEFFIGNMWPEKKEIFEYIQKNNIKAKIEYRVLKDDTIMLFVGNVNNSNYAEEEERFNKYCNKINGIK